MRISTLAFASLALAIQANQLETGRGSVDAAIVKPQRKSLNAFSSLLLAGRPAVVGRRSRATIPRTALNNARSADISMAATPELYVYDHCPFCVRVRLAMGILGKKHKLVFLENDDVETPTALVGKKISPIWVDEDGPMPESLDIIEKVDTEKRIAPASGRTDLKAWQKSVQTLMRKLQRPRYVMVPLPEFMKKGGRDAFVANHQMPPYEKSEWKGNPDFPIEKKYEKYEEAFAETADLLPEANAKLLELETMIHSAEACTEGIGLSYDDIDLWARLRSLTIIKGIQIPPKVRAYLDHFEKLGDVPLYDVMAV
jgi:glutaredoxin 2